MLELRSLEDPLPLQMYEVAPKGLISMVEFKKLARQRLCLLRAFEHANMKYNRDSPSYNSFIEAEIAKSDFLPLTLVKACQDTRANCEKIEEEIIADTVSHYVLRLAYCTSEDHRRWFLQFESDLFRFRFLNRLSHKQRNRFLTMHNFTHEKISEECKSKLTRELMSANPAMTKLQTFALAVFYKVHFTRVLDLVRCRKVFVSGGYAYVASSDMVAVVSGQLRSKLSRQLLICSRKIPSIHAQNSRLVPLLRQLCSGLTHSKLQPGSSIENIKADHLDDLSVRCFPPCMLRLHVALREHHHLKHQGRLMYWLFLKGIGLPLEENLRLFRTEFVDKGRMDSRKFEREHGYNIRHSYGCVGKRTSYTPYSCLKIIGDHPPSVGDYHGCPFRGAEAFLRDRLTSWNVPRADADEICSLSSGKHYQLACQRFFASKLGGGGEGPAIGHPNHYFIDAFHRLFGGEVVPC